MVSRSFPIRWSAGGHALGPRPVRAIARGVTAAPPYLWGVSIRVVLVGSGHHLGSPGERGVAPGRQALGLMLEGDMKESLCLVQPLVGL